MEKFILMWTTFEIVINWLFTRTFQWFCRTVKIINNKNVQRKIECADQFRQTKGKAIEFHLYAVILGNVNDLQKFKP